MLTRRHQTQTQTKIEEPKNPFTPFKVISVHPEYFLSPQQNVKVGIRLPSYKDKQSFLDCANKDTENMKISDEEQRQDFFNLSYAKHMVGTCLTQPHDFRQGYFSMAGDQAGLVLNDGGIIKLYNEINSCYQALSEIREPLQDAGIDRLVQIFKSIPEDSPLKKRLRIGFSFLLDLVN